MKIKWISVNQLNLIKNAEDPVERRKFKGRTFDPEKAVHVSADVSLARLVQGTEGGKSVATFQIDMADGQTICLEMSVDLLNVPAVLFRELDKIEKRPYSDQVTLF